MLEAGGGDHLGERLHRVAVEIVDSLGLVGDDERALAHRVLRRHADGAAVRVARQRLDAAEREHESASRVGPVGTERDDRRDIEGADDLAGGADLDPAPQTGTDEGVVHEEQALPHGHAQVVRELDGCGSRSALGPVHDDVVR